MMHHRGSTLLTACICLLSLILAFPGQGAFVAAGSARSDRLTSQAPLPPTAVTAPDSNTESLPVSSWSCLPRYAEPEFLLRVNATHPSNYEPNPHAADLNGDGLADIVIDRVNFGTYETFKLDVLLNDGAGGLALATSDIFVGEVPAVQNVAWVLLEDFNGDGRADIYFADHGYDVWPHPGYQNTLVLSAPNGKLVDATATLPQLSDFTHSACAADVDGDDDIDIYVGEFWGQNDIDPHLLLNDGSGKFSTGASDRLPPLIDLNMNGYTTCAFADVDNDGADDLILGDAGDVITNEHSTPYSEVLLNDGDGYFTRLPDAMPGKDVSKHDIAHDIKPIDLNGDAYTDLFTVYEGYEGEGTGWQGSYIQALVNNGDGTFRNETSSRLEPLDRQVWIRPLILRDLDRDGDQDLLAQHWDWQDADPILFLNDGRGHFGLEPLDFGLWYLYYAFLDLDGDGGHDLVNVSSAPPEDVFALRASGCLVYVPLVMRNWPASSR